MSYIGVTIPNMTENSNKLGDFILKQVEYHKSSIVALVAREFGITRQRAYEYVIREVAKGNLIKIGKTRNTRYFLANGKYIEFNLKITPSLEEDRVFSQYIKPMILKYPENIQRIINYGFTEILNNVIDHSEGISVYIEVKIDDDKINIVIMDNGVGIFNKIQKALNLTSQTEAILHLSKGKFTTAPSNHTGEGIFFTSRIFNSFSISSSDMFYTFQNRDWFLSPEKQENFGKGTLIGMSVLLSSNITPKEIMDQYADAEIGFHKTIVAVALSADPGDPHVSRSQAKRLMMGLEKFKIIVLDFKGVKSVGQAFVDEIFRVFKNQYPNIKIHCLNTNKDIDTMIKRGLSNIR